MASLARTEKLSTTTFCVCFAETSFEMAAVNENVEEKNKSVTFVKVSSATKTDENKTVKISELVSLFGIVLFAFSHIYL